MKKISYYIILLLIYFVLSLNNLYAQDLTFSQFYELPILRNPALAGIFDGDLRASAAYRNQWSSVTVPFKTGAASVEVKFPIQRWNDWITVGLQTTFDGAGSVNLQRTQILPVVNYHKSLGGGYRHDTYLSAAFMSGVVTSNFDISKVTTNNQFNGNAYDPSLPTNVGFGSNYIYWDASTGLSFNSGFGSSGRYYVGVGYFHLNQPRISFSGQGGNYTTLAPKWAFNAGLNTPVSELNNIEFYADYYLQGGSRQLYVGSILDFNLVNSYGDEEAVTQLNKKVVYAGIFYRLNDAIVPVIGMKYKSFNVGVSYDVNVSKLSIASKAQGGVEVNVGYIYRFPQRSAALGQVLCPR